MHYPKNKVGEPKAAPYYSSSMLAIYHRKGISMRADLCFDINVNAKCHKETDCRTVVDLLTLNLT